MGLSNMQLEPGYLQVLGPYTMRGSTGLLTGTLNVGGPPAENDLFAMRNVAQTGAYGDATRPLAVSRIVTKVIATGLAAADRLVLRWDKVVNFSSVHAGQTSLRARCRKTSDYDQDLPIALISGVIAGVTHMANATYSQFDTDEPFDTVFGAPEAVLAADTTTATYNIIAESIWTPKDNLPLVLEGNEGLVCGLVEDLVLGAATMRLFAAVDFAR